MAKKNSRDLFKQMNSNVSILEETDKSPILITEKESNMKTEYNTFPDKEETTKNKNRNTETKRNDVMGDSGKNKFRLGFRQSCTIQLQRGRRTIFALSMDRLSTC